MSQAVRQGGLPPLTVERIYTELRTSIRETDNISFRLLGLVPLVSGTALITVMLQKEYLSANLVMLLSLFAGSITLGLFRWELRNIQTCSWLIAYAAALEGGSLAADGTADLVRRPDAPQGIRKTEAEKLIYSVTIVTWLALPYTVAAVPPLSDPRGLSCVATGSLVFLAAVASILANAHHRPGPRTAVSD